MSLVIDLALKFNQKNWFITKVNSTSSSSIDLYALLNIHDYIFIYGSICYFDRYL